ncbi:DUF222 domain-containing protein [Actinomycetes bacterium KLBMP 9797]
MFDGGLTMAGLAAMPPGPELAAVLATIDRDRLNGNELVEVVKATHRQISHHQGELLSSVWASAFCPPGPDDGPPVRTDGPDEYAAEEVGWALVLTRRAAGHLFGTAYTMTERLPAVGAALNAGLIDLPRAEVLGDETGALSEPDARAVVDQILPDAPGLTIGQLRARLRRLVITIDPEAAARRQKESVKGRYLDHGLDFEGTARLGGRHLPPDRAAAAAARIDDLARAAKQAGDPRTLQELRADLFLDILNGERVERGATGGGVEIIVPLDMLIGLSSSRARSRGGGRSSPRSPARSWPGRTATRGGSASTTTPAA